MPDEKTRNDYDDGNIPEIDLPQKDEYEENSQAVIGATVYAPLRSLLSKRPRTRNALSWVLSLGDKEYVLHNSKSHNWYFK